MTTDVFASFGAFCEREGLSADTVRDLFRSDEASRELLVGLETGTLPEAEFERRFAEILGVARRAADREDVRGRGPRRGDAGRGAPRPRRPGSAPG